MTKGSLHALEQQPESPSTAVRRILVALNQREREFFLPDGLDAIQRDNPCHWYRTDTNKPEEWDDLVRTYNPHVILSCWSTPAIPLDYLEAPDRCLSYICNVTGSVRLVAPRRFLELGGLVSNWGDLAGPQVAEHALLLALGALRGIGAWRSYIEQVDGSLQYQAADLMTESLYGRSIGLHGFGRIARALLRLLKPFDVHVRAYSARVPESYMREFGVEPCGSLEELFSQSQVLFECEALTPESVRSVTGDVLARLPDGAVFVNIGRGAVVDEAALVAEAGRLRLAVDVATKEPIGADSPLFNQPKILLSPHIGGPTFDRYRACGEFALANLQAFLEGRPLKALLSLNDYDRST